MDAPTPDPPEDLNRDQVLAAERELYNYYAPYYRTASFFCSYFYQQERRFFVEWALSNLRESAGDATSLSYLDVGCGTGDILELFAGAGCRRLTGLDIAEATLSDAHHRSSPDARLIHGAIEDHDFGEEKFDAITCFLTLHHLFEPAAFFRLVQRHLSAEGRFFIFEYNPEGWWRRRGLKTVIHGLAMPLGVLFRLKNRRALARLDTVPALFNPAHRLLRFDEIRAAMPSRDAFGLVGKTRGVFVPTTKDALVADSGVDRLVYRTLDAFDRGAAPLVGGFFQYVMGRRTPASPS